MQKLSTSPVAGMQDDDRQLRDMIERLAQLDPTQPASACAGGDAAAFVDMVASEVDETVLPRLIEVLDGDRKIATLTVSNRRLVGISIDDDADPGSVRAGRAAEHYVKRLRALASGAGPIRLALAGRATGFSVEEASCSARDLRNAASQPERQDALGAFLTTVQDEAQAWVFRSDVEAEEQTDGPDGQVAALLDLERAIGAQATGMGAALSAKARKPSCTILPHSQTERIAIAVDGGGIVLAVVEAGKIDAITEGWKEAFRG